MTLKDYLQKSLNVFSRGNFKFSSISQKNINLIIYFFILIMSFLTYSITYNSINDQKKKNEQNLESFFNSQDFKVVKSSVFDNIKSPYIELNYNIEINDSIGKILKKFKVKDNEIQKITEGLKEKKLTNIYAGRKLNIILKKINENENAIINVLFPINNTLSVEIRKNKELFEIKENILKLNKKEVVIKNTINNNLYSAAIEGGIEPNIIIEFARIYGFEIDFQRDIRKGDTFEIYYEKFLDDNNIVRDTGKIIFAHMNVNNREINLYNFNDKNESGYYDISGKSIVKSLMKTPINGARLSSSFGMRKHPILGFNKMHRGTDFAAPTGTPIMASGSGTVTRARWCGGGGNCVKIRHNSTYETIYAHMSKFAKGVREGKKVKQGQIIGYVGSTGLSTGPHLHYEVVVNGKKINSQKLKLPSGKILKNKARETFELERIKIDLKLAELRNLN
jgi:murein DD-endopeptidase MepM/ murein hydrolase activator NlpD|tara:strand:- start:391 stop:1740 length:1350 start_codon:yes stop_codon:yes gene_type:complete